MTMVALIHCDECGRNKELEAKGLCRSCYHHQYYQEHKKRLLARKQDRKQDIVVYRQEHKKEIAAYRRRYRQKHKGRIAAYQRQWRKENREHVRQHREKTRVERAACTHQYYLEHREEKAAYDRLYSLQHPGKARCRWQRRRARLLNAPINDFTVADWKLVLEHYHHRCAYCGTNDKLTQDHIIPLSRGGWHTISNIVPACLSCNCKKGARTPSEAQLYLWQLPMAPQGRKTPGQYH